MIRPYIPERYVTQRNFKIAVVGAAVLAVVGFFTYQFKFLRAPGIEIFAPERDIAVTSGAFDARGRTDDLDADLTLNGRPLYSGETGEFTERIYLVKGVNRLEFEARNRYGRTTRLTRYVVLK
ncbi:MAG: hypothetical protein HY474_01245 [Candidatus Sungbacteria bacterium]|uniref:Uncharacterized protein n=1 Tax=Candidatus Sungiibacteriota bacterium TaxID=2750080 RepID=A0A933DRE0_9BACT|nr:hypothetical protein [Candidatus Sungbacteria bacterium]